MRILAVSRPTPSVTSEDLTRDMDEEIAKGREFYEDGLILQAYMDLGYTSTFMILEAASVAAAKARFEEYPQVRSGAIAFEFTPLIGMPAVAQVHERRGEPLPAWWPAAS